MSSTKQILKRIRDFEALNQSKRMTPTRDDIRRLDLSELTAAIRSLSRSKPFDRGMFLDLADFYLELAAVEDFCYESALFSLRWTSRSDLADIFLYNCKEKITQDEGDLKWLHLVATGIQKGFQLPQLRKILLEIIRRESAEGEAVNEDTLLISHEILELWIERNPAQLNDEGFLKRMRWSRTDMSFEQFLRSCQGNRGFRILTAGSFLRAQDCLYQLENSAAIDEFVLQVDSEITSVVGAEIAAKLISTVLDSRPQAIDLSELVIDKLFVSHNSKFKAQLLLLLSRLHVTILRRNRILEMMQLDPADGVVVRRIIRELKQIPQPFIDELSGYFKLCSSMGFLYDEESAESKFIRAYDDIQLRSSLSELIMAKRFESLTAGALHIMMGEASLEFKSAWIRKLDFRGSLDAVKIQAAAFQHMENDPEDDLISDNDAERLKRILTRWVTVCQDEGFIDVVCSIPLKKLCKF